MERLGLTVAMEPETAYVTCGFRDPTGIDCRHLHYVLEKKSLTDAEQKIWDDFRNLCFEKAT